MGISSKRIRIGRTVKRVVHDECELISRKNMLQPASTLWESLRKKCVICMKGIREGDLVTAVMYEKGGGTRSGPCHTKCLDGDENG